jgi:hypothetical protein
MKRFLTVGLLVALVLPAAASARAPIVTPPGNSSIGQYIESVPTAKGNRPTATITPGGGGGGSNGTGAPGASAGGGTGTSAGGASGALTPSATRALGRQGSGGRQVAALARATGSGRSSSRTGAAGASPRTVQPSDAVPSPASAVVKSLTGTGGGFDLLLPAILVLIAVVAGVLRLRRRPANN